MRSAGVKRDVLVEIKLTRSDANPARCKAIEERVTPLLPQQPTAHRDPTSNYAQKIIKEGASRATEPDGPTVATQVLTGITGGIAGGITVVVDWVRGKPKSPADFAASIRAQLITGEGYWRRGCLAEQSMLQNLRDVVSTNDDSEVRPPWHFSAATCTFSAPPYQCLSAYACGGQHATRAPERDFKR